MAKTIEIRPFADGNIVNNWWQWALVGVIAASGLIGIITGLFWICQTVLGKTRVCDHKLLNTNVTIEDLYIKQRKRKKERTEVPKRIQIRLDQHFRQTSLPVNTVAKSLPKPNSFGVYLGAFTFPLKQHDRNLFQRYDLLVLDPSQAGVLDILADASISCPPHVLSRLDLYQMLSLESKGKETPMLRSLERIISAIENILGRNGQNGKSGVITGIVFAGWYNLMSTALLNTLATYVSRLGL